MKKRLSKPLWYGTGVDSDGNPIVPKPATSPNDLEGLHEGELFLHLKEGVVTLWSLSADGAVVEISGGGGVDLSQYLLKSVWDKVWEIKTDSQGNEYIFGKLPVVTQYGITMYADGSELDLPSIYAGIPFDNKTIWLNPETKKVEVIGGTGGGVADSVHWNNIEGKPSFSAVATSGKYSDLSGLPDLSVYATTEYLTAELKKYVTLNTEQTIGAHKNFLNGLSIGGLGITKSQDDVIYLDANLVVRGGITMYATDTVDVPSIIDSLPTASTSAKGLASFDPNFFSVDVNGNVSFIGSTGGVDESVLADYAKKSDLSAYLSLNGGQMTGNIGYTLSPDSYTIGLPAAGYFEYSGSTGLYNSLKGYKSFLGSAYNIDSGAFFHVISVRHRNGLYDGNQYGLSIIADLNTTGGNLKWNKCYAGDWQGERVILDSVNWSQYVTAGDGGNYLPLSGGTITNSGTGLYINRTTAGANPHITFEVNGSRVGDLGIASHGEPSFYSYGMTGSTGWKRILYDGASTFELKDITIQQDKWGNGIALRRTATGGGAGISSYSQDIFLGIFGIGGAGKFEFSNKSNTTVFNVNQSGDVLANGGITMYSDQRKKTILNHVELTLQQIAEAPLIEHYYNSDENRTTHVGSIAQYWAGLNDWFCKKDSEGFYTMEIQNAALASAISIARELSRYESKTDKEIRLLKSEVKRLKKEIKILKSA